MNNQQPTPTHLRLLLWLLPGLVLLLLIIVPLPKPLFDDPTSTTLRAADGTLLSATLAADEQWRFPASDSVGFKFLQAVRLFEDEYFYFHPGFNPVSLFRAAWHNFRAGKILSGGSTITMQTIRLALKNPPRTYSQKLLEILTAVKLDLLYSKREILILYTDHAPFGGNIVGLQAASWRYFGREPQQLSWAETAFLAILPNQPSIGAHHLHPDYFLQKRNRLLDKLADRGYLSTDALFLAKQEALPEALKPIPQLAQHLLFRAMAEGQTGRNVITTLDPRLQSEARRRVNRYSKKMAANEIHNAAALIIEIATGNTMAYIGNVDTPAENSPWVDLVTARRSPGSLLKPVLYTAALDEGLILPQELLPDVPLIYQGFSPKNFDKKYRGAVPADQALASSLNVPFVHLLREYGYEKLHQKLQDLGLKSLDQPAGHYGLSLILGGGETTLWEVSALYAGMARAYFNFPRRPLNRGYSALDYHSNYYLKNTFGGLDVPLEKDGLLRAPSLGFTFRAMQQLRRPEDESGWQIFGSARPIAWKTGTSYGFRDAWALGLNNRYVVAVWLGNADGEGRAGLTGILAASPLLFDLFELLPGDAAFEEPFGSPVQICTQSGRHASPSCPQVSAINLPDYLREGALCENHPLLHLDAESQYQVNSSCYPVDKMLTKSWFVLPPVQAWYYRKYHTSYIEPPPFLPGCGDENAALSLALIYPRQFTRVFIPLEQDGQPGRVVFEAAHQQAQAVIFWHLDEQYLGQTMAPHQMAVSAVKGRHTITLVDDKGAELHQVFEVINTVK